MHNLLYHNSGSNSTKIPNHTFKLISKMTLKFTICIYDPTLRCGEKVVTKINPTTNVMVKYPKEFVK